MYTLFVNDRNFSEEVKSNLKLTICVRQEGQESPGADIKKLSLDTTIWPVKQINLKLIRRAVGLIIGYLGWSELGDHADRVSIVISSTITNVTLIHIVFTNTDTLSILATTQHLYKEAIFNK